jgi:hypothetical protein
VAIPAALRKRHALDGDAGQWHAAGDFGETCTGGIDSGEGDLITERAEDGGCGLHSPVDRAAVPASRPLDRSVSLHVA